MVTRRRARDRAHRPTNPTRQTGGGQKRCAYPLRTLPNRGRSGRIEGTRELVFPFLLYIAVYRLRGEAVEVVRIYHAAQDWP